MLSPQDTYFLSAEECITAGNFQNQQPNICRLSPDGHFGSKFVTVVATGTDWPQPSGLHLNYLLLVEEYAKNHMSFSPSVLFNKGFGLSAKILPHSLFYSLYNYSLIIYLPDFYSTTVQKDLFEPQPHLSDPEITLCLQPGQQLLLTFCFKSLSSTFCCLEAAVQNHNTPELWISFSFRRDLYLPHVAVRET